MNTQVPIEAFEIFIAGLEHPESLAFDSLGDLWVGTENGQLFRVSPERKVVPVAHLGAYCAGVAFSPKDELVALVPAIGPLKVSPNGEISPFGAKAIKGLHSGVFDSSGSLYATISGQWGKKNGYLVRLRSSGEPEILAGPAGYYNGVALSADGNQLFVVESDTNSIMRFAVGPDGALGKPELYSQHCGRFPAGIALDAEGGLLVSCFASDEIWRIGADGQKELVASDEWSLRLSSPTTLAYGGPELADIYVCNLARPQIARARLPHKGQPVANQRSRRVVRPRPAPL